MGTRRLRVGLVGAGVIAQVMHLHYLAELSDLFEVTAICDIVGGERAGVRRHGTASRPPTPTGAS